MALVLYDRVQQTGTANTTVSFTLSGSVTGYQSFSVVGNGNTTYYAATDTSGNWEVGLGTYSTTGPTLTRTTILSSSNSGSAVTFSGTVTVFVTYPSEQAVLGTLTANYVPYGNGTNALSTSSQFQYNGTYLLVGAASALGGLTNPVGAFTGNPGTTNYVQTYVYNAQNGISSSADLVAYASNSTDAHGWADMGFTSPTYADSTYTVTGPNEAYLLGSALNSSYTGNLVYATDSTGSANSHQWYVGGFTQAKSAWKMQLTSTGLQLANALGVAYGGTGLASGTSGGVLYYSASGTLASSAALAASAIVLGGGAGNAPATTTTGNGVVTALGVAVNTTSGGFPTIDGTATLTNKRVTPRTTTTSANSATPTLNTDNTDIFVITGQSTAITSFTTNLSGTPTNGQKLWISITGTTAIALTWGTSFEASTTALPTTTVSTNRLDVGFVWNVATSKWRCVAVA